MSKDFISTYYIGLNDKDLKIQLLDTKEYIQTIKTLIKENTDIEAYSLDIIQGCYKGITETTITIMLVNDVLPKCLLELIKNELNQECIMEVIKKECDVNFI